MTDLEMIDGSREFVVRIGRWMFKNWKLYHYTQHFGMKKPTEVKWWMWDRVQPWKRVHSEYVDVISIDSHGRPVSHRRSLFTVKK